MEQDRRTIIGSLRKEFAWYATALFLFLVGALTHLDTPGVYMDAVNPDYMVVRLLGASPNLPVWALPGTLLFGLFPVLGQIYHGALPYWLGLPSYALFGTGLLGIRLTAALFGSLVLSAVFILLRAFQVRRSVSCVIAAALALDPGFAFSFRSQFYILLLPLAFLFSGVAVLEQHRHAPTNRIACISGCLVGIAVYGYFIHLFLALAGAAHAAVRWRDRPNRVRLVRWWITGFAIGVSPYAIGLVLILVATGGWANFVSLLNNNLHTLNVGESSLSLSGRFVYFVQMVRGTVLGVGQSAVLLAHPAALSFPVLKQVILIAIPAVGLFVACVRRTNLARFGFFIASVSGLALLFLIFGARVWLTHAVVLLPVLYIGLALTLQLLPRNPLGFGVIACVMAPLVAGNANDRQTFLFALDRTGGAGLSSDSYERFVTDIMHDPRPVHVFFPDWGLFMPFAMITRGSVPFTPEFLPEAARGVLCDGRDVIVALVAGKNPDRIPLWIDQVGAGPPARGRYFQRDGVPALDILRWNASPEHTSQCAKG